MAQTAYIGVNPLNPRVESPEEVRDALVRAANFIPKERLGTVVAGGRADNAKQPADRTHLRVGGVIRVSA